MKLSILLTLLVVLFGVPAVRAQSGQIPETPEPAVQLKKKAMPAEAEPKQVEVPRKEVDVKGKAQPETGGLEGQVREILSRVTKNMRFSEERLAGKDAGDRTQQAQGDVLKDLDALIEQGRRQQQQQQQQSSSSSSSQSQQQRQSRQQQQPAKNRPAAPQSKPEPRPQPNEQRADTGQLGGRRDRGETSPLADLYKDIWGHLPAMMRQEMDQYAREQFMAKYSELLKQYYATIAEKSRRRGD